VRKLSLNISSHARLSLEWSRGSGGDGYLMSMPRVTSESDDEDPSNRSKWLLFELLPAIEGSDFVNGVEFETAVFELRGELFSDNRPLVGTLEYGD